MHTDQIRLLYGGFVCRVFKKFMVERRINSVNFLKKFEINYTQLSNSYFTEKKTNLKT